MSARPVRLRAPLVDGWVTVRGLRLHHLEWGTPNGFPLVLVHGGAAHAHWWTACVPTLADGLRVLACDLRGHGRSAPAPNAAYRITDYASDLAAWMDAMGLPPAHLVGHSLGGLVAVTYAAAHPTRVASLALVDSPLRISAATADYLARLERFPRLYYPSLDDAVRRFRLLPKATHAPADVLRHVATHAMTQLPDGRWTLGGDRAALTAVDAVDVRPFLQTLTCPTLLVRGADSTVVSAAAFQRLATLVPRVAQAEIPAAHHHVMLDQPAEFARVLRQFLTVPPGSPPSATRGG